MKIKQFLILIPLIMTSLQADPLLDNYYKVCRVGKDFFVAVGEKYAHLYDSSLNKLNFASKKDNNKPLEAVTVYPLNYTLILESDKTLTSIKWNGDKDFAKIHDVDIGGFTEFHTLTCLDDSTLCYVNTHDGYMIRFDIRTIHDSKLKDPFFLKTPTANLNYENLMITDTNLNYFYG